jgi:tRNA (cmo5U34)-methyltransferase
MCETKGSTTNIRPRQLNYDSYSAEKYDREIVNFIPFHKDLHELLSDLLSKEYRRERHWDVMDMGVGTGLTSKVIQDCLPHARLDVVDFSPRMLQRARRRLGNVNVNYIKANYSKLRFEKRYDIIVSVIGIHHQTDEGKRLLFKRIYRALKLKGTFVFGDLVTYRDRHIAALNEALHIHHLVESSRDKKTLMEWSHHHKFLNLLSPIEDQLEWLEKAGFEKPRVVFNEFNTALIIARKD